jgi:hypothetical protein
MPEATPTQQGPDTPGRQAPPDAPEDSAPERIDAPEGGGPANPQALIRESIKYRRRAQEAERRVEALDAELRALREDREAGQNGLEEDLQAARAETQKLRTQLDAIEATRRLESELVRAGCGDVETALAVAERRLAEGPGGEDPAEVARQILQEKPHLRGAAAGRSGPPLPPRTAGAKPAGADPAGGATERLAERARRTGQPSDLAAYMRARRGS